MKKIIWYLLLFVLFTVVNFSYTLDDVLYGVEKTTSAEYSLPYFQWMNRAQGEVNVGYDPFEKKGIFGVQAGVQVFENVDMNTSLSISTDFASNTDYLFSAGVTYNFLSTGESETRYREAQKETVRRKLTVIDLFFEFLKKKVLLRDDDGTDILITVDNKMTQVEMAYLTIKIEALSSLPAGEPQINGLSTYVPVKIDDDVVQIAVRRYLNTFNPDKGNQNSLYAIFRTDYNSFSQGITGGIGGSMDFEQPVANSVQNKLDEIEIRKYKLLHDIIVEQLPVLKSKYLEIEKILNSATTAVINRTMTTEQVVAIKEQYFEIEDRILEMTIEAVKLEAIFKVLVGDM